MPGVSCGLDSVRGIGRCMELVCGVVFLSAAVLLSPCFSADVNPGNPSDYPLLDITTFDITYVDGEPLIGGKSTDIWYDHFLKKLEEAENAQTQEEKDKALYYAEAYFQMGAYMDLELRGRVDMILKPYIESGRIVEIEPDSGELGRVKSSGADALVVFLDNNYSTHPIQLRAAILAKMLVEKTNVDVYIYPINEAKDYSNKEGMQFGNEVLSEGVDAVPSLKLLFTDGSDIYRGGPESTEELYSSVGRLSGWVKVNTDTTIAEKIHYNNSDSNDSLDGIGEFGGPWWFFVF